MAAGEEVDTGEHWGASGEEEVPGEGESPGEGEAVEDAEVHEPTDAPTVELENNEVMDAAQQNVL